MVTIPPGAGGASADLNKLPGFSPEIVTVVVGVNSTVIWDNNDSARGGTVHTVTPVMQPAAGNWPSAGSGNLGWNQTYEFTFTVPGTYNYTCAFHSWMRGTVIVKPASAQPASPVLVSIPKGAGSPGGAPGYAPDKITVVVGVNNTVEWTNNDAASHHTVTSVSGNGSLNSGDMPPGANYSYTFTTPGTYNYLCVYHSWMTGTVVVKPASAVPEFPIASLALILFVVIAVVMMLAAPGLRQSFPGGSAGEPPRGRP